MHRQELLRAGSRRAYHPGVGWNLGAAKSCMFQSLGSEDLYPVVRTRFSVVFGNALFDSTDGGCFAYYLLAARRDEGYHPTRASERGRAKGRPDDTEQVSKNRQPSLDQQHIRISIGRYRLPPQFRAIIFLPGATSPFCDAIQNIVVDVDPRPSAVAGQDQNTLTWSGPIPLSETAFNGCFGFYCLFFCLAV